MNHDRAFMMVIILFCFIFLSVSFCSCQFSSKKVSAPPELDPLNLEMLGMPRGDIANGDHMLWIFNGRGKVYPRRYSLTGFDGFEFKHYVGVRMSFCTLGASCPFISSSFPPRGKFSGP